MSPWAFLRVVQPWSASWWSGPQARVEVVDVGDGVDGVGVAVVGLAEVGGHGAARKRAPAVFGVQHDSLGR